MLSTLVPALMQQNSTAANTPMNSTQGPAVGHGEANTTQVPDHQGQQAQQAQGTQAPPEATGWDWNGTQWQDWDMSWRSDSRRTEEDRPYINHRTFPQFDGAPNNCESYRWEVLNLKYQCTPRDFKFLAPKLIS